MLGPAGFLANGPQPAGTRPATEGWWTGAVAGSWMSQSPTPNARGPSRSRILPDVEASWETTPVAFSSFKKKFLNQTADVTVRETGCHRRCGAGHLRAFEGTRHNSEFTKQDESRIPSWTGRGGARRGGRGRPGSAASSWPPFALGSAPFLRSRRHHLAFLAP